MLIKIEDEYQHPVDIEWAFHDDVLYLLQVRPITTYLPLPEEMITEPGEPKRLYADSTLIEQGVEEPLSVLGTEFLRYVLNTMTGPMGGNADSVESGAFTAGGRYYMNLSKSLQMVGPLGALAPGSAGDETIMGILEDIDTDQYVHEKQTPAQKLRMLSGPMKMIHLMLPVGKAMRKPDEVVQRYHAALPEQLAQIEAIMDKSLSLHELAEELTGKLDFFFYGFGVPMVFGAQLAQQRIRKTLGDDLDQVKEHFLSLGTALPGNKTSEMGAMMASLAGSEVIAQYSTAGDFLKDMGQDKLHPEFVQRWDAFIAEYGARCPREIDPATPRMNENPALLFDQLKRMAAAEGTDHIFEEAKRKREAAYAKLYQLTLRKGKKQAAALERAYRTWVTLGGYRETPKHYVIWIVNLFRKRALEVADTLVRAGRLDDREQIFDLTIIDIDHALADPGLDLRAIAAERTALIQKIKRSKYVARVLDSRGKIFFPPRKAAKDGELAGVPISSGVVQGRVKVLHTADEKEILPGEILVTRATDPGWTPLFINAGGVILEIGGALQHGAVVAREYGLPCVSGITQATEILKDGQLVEVDGSNGIVRVLEGEIGNSPDRVDFKPYEAPEIEAKREKVQVKQNMKQRLIRIIPLLVLPIVVLIVVVIGFMVVKLLSGTSFPEAVIQLARLWQRAAPVLIGITNIMGVAIVLTTLWKNRKKLQTFIEKKRD